MESFFSLLQKNVLNARRWDTREQLRLAIVAWTERTYHRIGRSVELVRDGAREAGKDPDRVRVLLRAVVELTDRDPGRGRRLFQGTLDQVLDDLAAMRARGVTDAFVDLNFSPLVGSPDVDADRAVAEAERVLDALAPGTSHVRKPRPSA